MLTRRKKEFIMWYIKTKNATESAKRAGYGDKYAYQQGHRLLKDVEVKQEIERKWEEVDRELALTEGNVKKNLLREALEAKTASNRIRAWELLGKSIGMFKEIPANQQVTIFADLEKELKARYGGREIIDLKDDNLSSTTLEKEPEILKPNNDSGLEQLES